MNIQLLDYDKERQELLEGGFLEPAINEDLLTRELPVNFVVCTHRLWRFTFLEHR